MSAFLWNGLLLNTFVLDLNLEKGESEVSETQNWPKGHVFLTATTDGNQSRRFLPFSLRLLLLCFTHYQRGLATAFDLAAFRLSMALAWKLACRQSFENCSEHARNGLGTTTRRSSSYGFSTVWSEFPFGTFGHCFLCCNYFFFPRWCGDYVFLSSGIASVITCRFITLRTRPDNSHCTSSSMPDLLTHFTSLDVGSQAVFLFSRPTGLKEAPTLQCVCRRVYTFKWKTQN